MTAEWIDLPELMRRAPNFSERTLERLIASGQITCRQRKKGAKRSFNWVLVERELALLDSTPARSPITTGAAAPQLVQLLAEAEGFCNRLRQLIGRAA